LHCLILYPLVQLGCPANRSLFFHHNFQISILIFSNDFPPFYRVSNSLPLEEDGIPRLFLQSKFPTKCYPDVISELSRRSILYNGSSCKLANTCATSYNWSAVAFVFT